MSLRAVAVVIVECGDLDAFRYARETGQLTMRTIRNRPSPFATLPTQIDWVGTFNVLTRIVCLDECTGGEFEAVVVSALPARGDVSGDER
jgi:hypothetical protein